MTRIAFFMKIQRPAVAYFLSFFILKKIGKFEKISTRFLQNSRNNFQKFLDLTLRKPQLDLIHLVSLRKYLEFLI